jgi:hypothetical protein
MFHFDPLFGRVLKLEVVWESDGSEDAKLCCWSEREKLSTWPSSMLSGSECLQPDHQAKAVGDWLKQQGL